MKNELSCTVCKRHHLEDEKCLHAKAKVWIEYKKYSTETSNHNDFFYAFCLHPKKPVLNSCGGIELDSERPIRKKP